MPKPFIRVFRLSLFSLLAVALSGPVLTQPLEGRSTQEIVSRGVVRSYMIHVPEHGPGRQLPLVFNLHGSGGTPQNQEDVSGFIRLADEHGFVVVYPQGLFSNSLSPRSWNANAEPGVDDVQFIRDIIRVVGSRVNIDAGRIYATGFSGGARMSSRLACELSDVLAAAAPVAGLQYPDGCTLARPVPILTIHGMADLSNTYTLQADSRPYWRMGVETAIDRWRQANGCSLDNDTSYLTDTVIMHAWSQCTGGAEVVFYVITDGAHTWPGNAAQAANPNLGVTNMDIDASELIWDFFSRHSKAQ